MKIVPKSTSQSFFEHVKKLEALAGRDSNAEAVLDARRSLACMSLLAAGWRYGDPDPPDGGPDDDDGEPVPVDARYELVGVLFARAA